MTGGVWWVTSGEKAMPERMSGFESNQVHDVVSCRLLQPPLRLHHTVSHRSPASWVGSQESSLSRLDATAIRHRRMVKFIAGMGGSQWPKPMSLTQTPGSAAIPEQNVLPVRIRMVTVCSSMVASGKAPVEFPELLKFES